MNEFKKISYIDFFLSVIETSVTTNTEQERDLRRHSHIGTFDRRLSIDKKINLFSHKIVTCIHRY